MVLNKKSNRHINFIFPPIVIISLVFLVYLQNLWFDFSYLDDNLIVFTEFNKIDSFSKIPKTFSDGYLFENYYRPIVMISFIIDTAIAGQSPMMYHLTNLLLHLLVCLLVYLLLTRITQSKIYPLLLTSFFCIHPLNVNAVSWIVGRNDLIVAFFAILSIYCFIKYVEEKHIIYIIISSISYLLAMYSKEIGLLIPIILFAYILLIKTEIKRQIVILPIIVSYFIPLLTYLYSRFVLSTVKINEEISLYYFVQNLNIPLEYLTKTIYFFAFNPLPMKNIVLISVGLLLVIFLSVSFLFSKHLNKKLFLFGTLFFIIFLTPTLFVRIKSEDLSLNYYDCRSYLPFVGFLIVVTSFIEAINLESVKTPIKLSIIVIFIYTLSSSIIENQDYKNGETFWGKTIESYPDRATNWIGLGTYYFNMKNYDKAIKCGETAIKIKPNVTEYYYKTASAYVKKEDYYSAIRLINKVLKIEKNKDNALFELMKLNFQVGDSINVQNLSNQLVDNALRNNNGRFLSLASYYNFKHGRIKLAIDYMKLATQIDSLNKVYLNDLGSMYFKFGEVNIARNYFFKALKLDPENIEFKNNLNLCK